jgi:hypothetical protein
LLLLALVTPIQYAADEMADYCWLLDLNPYSLWNIFLKIPPFNYFPKSSNFALLLDFRLGAARALPPLQVQVADSRRPPGRAAAEKLLRLPLQVGA